MTLSVEQHVCVIERMIKTVEKDCRDEWPTNNQSYTKGRLYYHFIPFSFSNFIMSNYGEHFFRFYSCDAGGLSLDNLLSPLAQVWQRCILSV